ncbi:cysteine dioxygenase [Carboxylicivirga sp. N1Y90]|uniref:cysteine dioxygenase n=1 Tax=Carboxylicivirga fragile TaxID=3417571 RepID=UPI003D34ED25|nr:cysteine dioxygenase family protein [Marinilabiliaceae bacterium N1Y90]
MGKPISQSLQNLIESINNECVLNNTIITNIIKQNKIVEKDIEPFTTFDHPDCMSYGRELIFKNEQFKILLMSWKPGDFTAIHNHGETEWGCVCFFGEAVHRLYSTKNNELKLIKKDKISSGQVLAVKGSVTHMMGNAGEKSFVTLHIYGSNTKNKCGSEVTVYMPEFQKMVSTSGSAYINMPNNLILTESAFSKTQNETLVDYLQLIKPFYKRNNNIATLNKLTHS